MKNLLAALALLFLMGVAVHSSTNAKVLPIIEGAELLDTLDAQNNDKIIQPELSAGIYKNVDLRHLFYAIEKCILKEGCYSGEWLSFIRPYTILFFLKPSKGLRYNDQILFQYNLVKI